MSCEFREDFTLAGEAERSYMSVTLGICAGREVESRPFGISRQGTRPHATWDSFHRRPVPLDAFGWFRQAARFDPRQKVVEARRYRLEFLESWQWFAGSHKIAASALYGDIAN